jgi:hypothetical protein
VFSDQWIGVWQVESAGDYVLTVDARQSDVRLALDGVRINGRPADVTPDGPARYEFTVTLAPGPHPIAIIFREPQGPFMGGTLTIKDGTGQDVQPSITPY